MGPNFKVGQKVRCIKETPLQSDSELRFSKVGVIYTVERVLRNSHDIIFGISLVEDPKHLNLTHTRFEPVEDEVLSDNFFN